MHVHHMCSSDHYRPPHSIETLSAAAEKASGIPAYLPNCVLLKDTIRKAREWLQEAEELQVWTPLTCMHFILFLFSSDFNTEWPVLFQGSGGELMMGSLSDMVLRGQAIQVHLEPLDRLESLMVEVQEWKECAATEFLQKESPFTLLEVNHHFYRLELYYSFLSFFLLLFFYGP